MTARVSARATSSASPSRTKTRVRAPTEGRGPSGVGTEQDGAEPNGGAGNLSRCFRVPLAQGTGFPGVGSLEDSQERQIPAGHIHWPVLAPLLPPEVIGVAELVNKINGPWFSKFDEDLATAFSIYCGISIAHVSGAWGGDKAGPSVLLSPLGLRAPLLGYYAICTAGHF